MPVKRDGRRLLAKVTGATSMPGPSAKKNTSVSHSTTATAKANAAGSRKTPVRFPIRASDALAWTIITLVVGVVLIAACVLLTLGWPS